MTRQARSRHWVVAVLATALAGCGSADGGVSTPVTSEPVAAPTGQPAECAAVADPEPVGIRVQWEGPWDPDAAPALIERFETAAPGGQVEVAEPVETGGAVAMLLGADPPTLARVPADSVRSLVRAGAIRPIDDCVDDRLIADGELDAVRQLGLVDGARYGVAGNVDFTVMLYDAVAFGRAGLDPASPPATWGALYDAGVVLRDRAGIERPIAGLPPAAVLTDDALTDQLSTSASEWRAMRADGLLLDPRTSQAGGLPPLGEGSAAIEFVHASSLWGYARAVADGQAPAVDLRVAASPGSSDERVMLGGDVWVISARSTPGQALLASALLNWLVAPPQQATLHTLTDLLPTTSSAAADPVAVSYWKDLPLLAEVWSQLSQAAAAPSDWTTAPGAALAAGTTIASEGDGVTIEQQWSQLNAALATSTALDPVELLGCVYPLHDPPAPLTACIPTPGT